MSRIQHIWLLLMAVVASIGTNFAQQQSVYGDEDLYVGAPILESDTPKKYRISDVRVYGVYNNAGLIPTSAGIVRGDSIYLPGSFTSSVMERLWNQKRFSDIKMGATIDGGDVILDLYFTENPRVLNWAITGLTKGQRTTLMEELNLRRGSELSDFVINKGKNKIKEYFVDKGYRNAEVDVRIETDSLRADMVNVTFVTDRKSKVKIGEIIFEGNEAFDDNRLQRALSKTKQKGKLLNTFKSSKLDEAELENDKVELIDFYNSRGYRNATVVSDSIYDINNRRIGLKINVSEGNKYYIRNISWVGNTKYETEHLQRIFGIESGDVYDKKSMNKRLGRGKDATPDDISILTLYQNEGYLTSQIEPSEIVVGVDSLDLEIKIFEGNQFTINNVTIMGNQRLDDEVIRRELYTRPGDLYNRSLLMQTMRALTSIGHFNPESVMPGIDPVTNSNDLVDIVWPLEEQASDQFNVSGGWGAGTFVASVGITLNNLSVRNMVNGGKWAPYPTGQNQKLSISAQTNGTYYKAFSLSFSEPWLGGKKPNSLSTSVFYSEQNDAYYAWESSTKYFRTFGAALGIGTRLLWPDPYFTLYGELSYQRYMLDDWSSFLMTDGNANLISLGLTLSRSTIDQQMYPRSGTNFSASLQITPPFSLWDGKDYSDEDLSDDDRYRFIEFHKWELKAEWYQGFLKNSNLVLMLRTQMGYLGCYDQDNISPFERFEVGGDGMSGYNSYGIDVVSIRGYEDGALDPTTSDYSIGYNKYTMELRYPVIMESSSQIYVLGFLEGGNGFSSWKTFSPFNVKRSAGVGVRVYLPIVGSLGLDWGYGFDAPSLSTNKSGSQFHFVMGQQF